MLEVITGCMYAGKTSELLRRVQLSQIAGLKCFSYKHSLDERYSSKFIATHPNPINPDTGQTQYGECMPVRDAWELSCAVSDAINEGADVISIDEIHFFNKEVISVLSSAADRVRVIVAGLSLDAYGIPFDIMPDLLVEADEIKLLYAVCTNKVTTKEKQTICGKKATRTLVLETNDERKGVGPLISVGSYAKYAARCRTCWVWG